MNTKRSSLFSLALAAASVLAAGQALAQNEVVISIDFNSDPAASNLYIETGSGSAYWSPNHGATGKAGDGFLAITDARGGQGSAITFNNTPQTENLVVAAFRFEADLRIGGGTAQPADGFSINYVREPSGWVDAIKQGQHPGNLFNGTDNEGSLPEEGVREGLAIGFDTWQSATIGGVQDVVGISIRFDQTLIAQFPVPLRPGNVFGQAGAVYNEAPFRNLATNNADYASSMQTGALSSKDLNGDGEVNAADAGTPQPTPDDPRWIDWIENLTWERFIADVNADGFVKIFWKGVELTPSGGFKTAFSPYKGRVVFAGRTGGAWEVHHVDNIKLTLQPSTVPIWGGVTGNPVGFETSISDSGPGVFDPASLVVKLNGVAVTPKSVTKEGGITTIRVFDVATPFASGSTNRVELTGRALNGNAVLGSGNTKEFVVAPYTTLPASLAVPADTSKPGFTIRWHQVAQRPDTIEGWPNNIARAEQQLYGLRGANLFNPPLIEEVTGVINYDQAGGNAGSWNGNTEPVGTYAETPMPLPDFSYTDNIAAEIETYIHFPEAGVYNLIFNSDDGFRTTIGANVSEVFNSITTANAGGLQFDGGRGASDSVASLYVPTAGYYPVRTVWFEGGGGANFEWVGEQVVPNKTGRALLNDTLKAGSLKTFRARTGSAPAAVSFVHPARNTGNPYLPTVPIIVELEQGGTPIDQGSVKLTLNGTQVTATATPGQGKLTLRHTPASPLPSGNNTLKVEFTAGTQQYSGENTFTVRTIPSVPASLALPASAVNRQNVGFLVKTRQQDSGQSMANNTYRGLTHIAGLIGLPNTADLGVFTGPGGYYVEPNVINYDQAGGSLGFFNANNGFTETLVPGIPGTATAGGGTDNFVQEILTVLDLRAGVHAMNVNSDDGFWLAIGNPAEVWTFPTVVGEFSGGRGASGAVGGGTTFYFEIKQAGLYPARLVWYEGGGGANIEWSSAELDANGNLGGYRLINDIAATAVKAFQYPITSAGAPYVKAFKPGRADQSTSQSANRAGRDTDVMVEIADGVGNIDPATVSMTINGTAVTPTATKAAGVTTVRYKPAADFGPNQTVNAAVTFGDRTVSWQFRTGDIGTTAFFIEAEDFNTGGGQSQAAASVMPYYGGAYAGLAAVANVDYSRANEASSPIYRVGEDPQVPMDRTGDRDRGLMDIAVNYKLGWIASGQWFNYTRNFPTGRYNVYAGVSHGDGATSATRIGGALGLVTSSPSQPNQTVQALGTFDGPATGGWGNNRLVPLRDSNNNLVALDLGGTQTVRYSPTNGDFDFILFTAVGAEQVRITGATIAGANITVTWTGGGTLESTPSLTAPITWTSTGDSDGSYTAPVGSGNLYFRVKK